MGYSGLKWVIVQPLIIYEFSSLTSVRERHAICFPLPLFDDVLFTASCVSVLTTCFGYCASYLEDETEKKKELESRYNIELEFLLKCLCSMRLDW